MATLINSSIICRISIWVDFKKFLRAGTLKNKFLMAMFVPAGH